MRKRNNEIKVRFTDEELAVLDAKVGRTYRSRESYIRGVLAGHEIMEAMDVETTELLKQIRRVGNSLNQLTFLAQCQGFINVPDLQKMADGIWACQRAIMKAYTPPGERSKIWGKEDA